MGFIPFRPALTSLRHIGAAVRDQRDDASVTAAPGSCLWRIAAEHLGPAATDWEIAHEWPRWYRANRRTIGDDPADLRAGTVLRPPRTEPDHLD